MFSKLMECNATLKIIWKHSDAKSLEEIHKDESFRSELENLAQKEDANLKPHLKWIRAIGRIPEDARGRNCGDNGFKNR